MVLGTWSISRADSIFVGSLERKNAVIREVRGNALYFEINQRPAEPVEVSKITRLVVNNEPVFNAAEEAYAAQKFDAAVDGYQKTLRGTTKPWLKDFAAMRLIDAANHTNRFDAAASAYVAALMRDPAAAARIKPAMPDAKSTYLDTAVTEVNTALNSAKLADEQKQALLTFLVELHRARQDNKAAADAVERLLKISPSSAKDPQTKLALAEMKLTEARVALDADQFDKAIATIESSKATFIDPNQQAEALFCLAEAKFGLATKSNDATAWKDAALAYMRVVASFDDQPARPHVAASLMKTAQIHERLGEPQTAAQLYEQIAREFADDASVAAEANQNLQRLRGAARTTRNDSDNR